MHKFPCSYLDAALSDLESVVEHARTALDGVEFDTFVGTGFSGAIVIPTLALTFGKSFVLIRKDNDDSHHGKGKLLGTLGQRWIFVDDFVSSGATKRRVIGKIEEACHYDGISTPTLVGEFMYASDWQRASGYYPAATHP